MATVTEYFDKQRTKGRPRMILNDKGKKMVETLAGMMCTDEEIAAVLECSVETLQTKDNLQAFSDCKKKGQDKGKASLRRLQFKAADKGNTTMLIFLGKQYLQQRDQIETNTPDTKININVSAATTEDISVDD